MNQPTPNFPTREPANLIHPDTPACRILVVEWEGMTRLMLLRWLRLAGFQVDWARHESIATKKLRDSAPDVLLLGLPMRVDVVIQLIQLARRSEHFAARPIYLYAPTAGLNRVLRRVVAANSIRLLDRAALAPETLVAAIVTDLWHARAPREMAADLTAMAGGDDDYLGAAEPTPCETMASGLGEAQLQPPASEGPPPAALPDASVLPALTDPVSEPSALADRPAVEFNPQQTMNSKHSNSHPTADTVVTPSGIHIAPDLAHRQPTASLPPGEATVAEGGATRGRMPAEQTAADASAVKSILLVEDDPFISKAYRQQLERVEPVDVNLAIKEVVELTRPRWRDLPQQHGVAIQIKCELDASLQPLASDASELRQALTNLIFNAVDAMPNGGVITVATQAQQRAAAGAAAPPAPAVQIEVRDQGVGMDEETRKRCLEPFFSTKTQRGGTGLGLAMVYGMVQRQRGEITIESAPGDGSCIRLILPLVEAPSARPSPTRVTAVGPMTNLHLRVLYLDDEPMVRGVIGDGLRSFQHEVIIASSGDSALQMFHYAMQTPKPFDAVITDLGMPNMNGMDFARAIKTRAPATPVIMLTGWNTRTMTESGHDRSVDAVLATPVSLANLNASLLRVAGVVRPTAVG